MAKLLKGIFGPVSGKLCSVVGASWKSIAYLRSLPKKKNAKQTIPYAYIAQGNQNIFLAKQAPGDWIQIYTQQKPPEKDGVNLKDYPFYLLFEGYIFERFSFLSCSAPYKIDGRSGNGALMPDLSH